ncbi:MAG: hypothetical protein GX754_06515 [Clostridiaceae bacterium]|nr:hypothetical protein [Clostridiaceae bacterium]
MAEVYCYIPAGKVEYVVECGVKLSEWHDKEVVINGFKKKCITALLNPKDDMDKYHNKDFVCVKLEVPNNYCFVADRYLYRAGINMPGIMPMYYASIVPINDYVFGMHRLPECLVTSTVIAGQVKVMNRIIDSPVLFNNSEELYLDNIIEMNKEERADFKDAILYYFYSKLAELKKIDKIEDKKEKTAIFIDRGVGRVILIKIPGLEREQEQE